MTTRNRVELRACYKDVLWCRVGPAVPRRRSRHCCHHARVRQIGWGSSTRSWTTTASLPPQDDEQQVKCVAEGTTAARCNLVVFFFVDLVQMLQARPCLLAPAAAPAR